jgi:hypothetical protein
VKAQIALITAKGEPAAPDADADACQNHTGECPHVVEALEHDLLDEMPAARGDEQIDSGEEDLIPKHKHVELDLLGVLRHDHVQY